MKRRTRFVLAVAATFAVLAAFEASRVLADERFEEGNSAVTWSGAWSANSQPGHSGGGAKLSMDEGAQATFTFRGASVSWIGYRDQWSGMADVILDGELRTTVDTYATPSKAQVVLFTASDLDAGSHSLTIRVKGTHSKASAGSWIWIDAFVTADPIRPAPLAPQDSERMRRPSSSGEPPADLSRNSRERRDSRDSRDPRDMRREDGWRFEEDRPALVWSGPWSTNRLPAHSGHSAKLAMEESSRVDFEFTGTAVTWIGYRDEWSGIADVLLDGKRRATVDTYSKPARAQVAIYTLEGLREGPHTLTIQPTGRKAQASGGAWIWVDAFSVRR